ncbi:lysophospholipase [Stieleria sp. TO1_6]|uniref:alpha/beta hydrolase n=1 Tax=Stieleria tagensis TaxID=2956795 RepID=UPI00209B9223|nr:alpha/beta hydrolase [Stieleria tagensis]MCO8121756.1 lysophospholipase [Stieleria tagensis]
MNVEKMPIGGWNTTAQVRSGGAAAANWHARLWTRGDHSERGVVILVHGLGDHGGRFESFARRVTRSGWAVLAVDLPGHGRSAGRRGALPRYDDVLAGIAAARQQLSDRFDGQPQVLLGHSMGGNFAINYALRQAEFDGRGQPPVDGVVLVAPMLLPPQLLDRQKIFAAWGTGHLLPWIRVSKPAPIEQLTRHREMADRIQNDPLQHSQISLYLATQLVAQGRHALDHAGAIETPTLVIYGSDDQLIDRAACRNLALRMRGRGRVICWPDGRHDLVNDIDADQVTAELTGWMNRLGNRSATGMRPQSVAA